MEGLIKWKWWIHAGIWLLLFLALGDAMTYPKEVQDFELLFGHWKWVDLTGTIFNVALFYWMAEIIVPKFFLRDNILRFLGVVVFCWFVIGLIETVVDYLLLPAIWENDLLGHYFFSLLFKLSAFSILALAYRFIVNWFRNERLSQEKQKEQLEMELRFLKAQISPHFLFNTLNNIYGEAIDFGADAVAAKIARLSGLMRYMLYETETEEIALEKEIECIEALIELHQLRVETGDSLEIDFKVEGQIKGKYIVPMILIPFVENAFKHGFRYGEHCPVSILISTTEKEIRFETKNRVFDAQNTVDEHSGLGLENIRKRLELIYSENHSLKISKENNWYIVELRLKNV